jgi:hypothetical protein
MSEKLFTVAGVSRTPKGELKARFATDLVTRTKVLQKDQTDIDLIELKEPMTKADAVAFLLGIQFATTDDGVVNAEKQAALEEALEKRAPKSAKKEQKGNKEAKKPKKEKPTAAAPTLATIRAKAAPKSTKSKATIEAELRDTEDAPF